MKVKLFVLSALVVLLLIGAAVFRYQTIETTHKVNRYMDRWTGVEWVKETHATGVTRTPAQFYNSINTPNTSAQDVLSELIKVKRKEDACNVVYFVLLGGSLLLGVYSIWGNPFSRQSAKGVR